MDDATLTQPPYDTQRFICGNVSHVSHIIGGSKMVSITLAVPQELKSEMDKHTNELVRSRKAGHQKKSSY